MSKHIVIDARESGTTTGRYVDKLIEHMHALGAPYKISVVTKPDRTAYFQEIAPMYQVIASNHKEFTFAEQLGLLQQIKGLQPDLVHFSIVQQPVFYTGKVVTTMHDLTTIRFRNPAKNPFIFTIKQHVYKWVNKRVAKKSIALITPTEYVKQDVAAYTHVSAAKIVVTYESADTLPQEARPIAGLADKQFIMYVGRPQPHKNLNRLIDAFKLLKETHPNLVLVLAGKLDDLYRLHQKRVSDESITNVVFTDFISDGQLRWLYENCAAYVFPSLSEGFGLPGVEAMLHGAPLASSNATCLPEVYGDAAAYFDPTNSVEMAATIHAVITDDTLRETLIRKGTKQCKKYSWKKTAQQTLEVYNRVLES